MNSILMSISPYWGFLIIAEDRGWDLAKYGLHKKTVEVRKRISTSSNWNRKVALYFTKDKKSLQQIPEEYRGEVAKLCGTVVCEFVCDEVLDINVFENGSIQYWNAFNLEDTCIPYEQLAHYIGYSKKGYGLHISDLKIYDKPKELSDFRMPCEVEFNSFACRGCDYYNYHLPLFDGVADLSKSWCADGSRILKRAPQSWCYVEEVKV